jgi:hypothetical protein
MLILKQDFLFDHFFIIFKIGNQYIMKKKLLKTVLSILVLCSFYTSYGQVIKSASEPLKIINKQTQLIQSHSSPDLNHHHDGEHCISDALTNDWVTK